MQDSELPDTETPPDGTQAMDRDALAELVRERLGRRMIVAVLAPPDESTEALRALANALAAFAGARVAYERPLADGLETLLARLHSLGPDVVLVGAEEGNETTPNTPPWHARVFAVADRIGLCDRSFVALTGVRVTRASARRAGFEDGFPLDTPLDALLPLLIREALARDEFRRHGSSPPCYLE